jgi:hypothetical protein
MAARTAIAAVLTFATTSFAAHHHHIGDASVSPLTVPQLRGGHKAALASGAPATKLFKRHKTNAKGKVPDMYDEHSFVGATDAGFVDFGYHALLRGETVVSDDYQAFFRASRVICTPVLDDLSAPAPDGTAPVYVDGVLKLNNVRIVVDMTPALTALNQDAVNHIHARFAAGDAALAFGVELLSSHPHFAKDSTCAIQVPFSAPYFKVSSFTPAPTTDGSLHWTLDLLPVSALSLFHFHSANFSFSADAEAEVQRRIKHKLNVGQDVRTASGRRAALSMNMDLAGMSMNYDATNKKATNGVIELIPSAAGALTCTNCYARVGCDPKPSAAHLKSPSNRATPFLPLNLRGHDADSTAAQSRRRCSHASITSGPRAALRRHAMWRATQPTRPVCQCRRFRPTMIALTSAPSALLQRHHLARVRQHLPTTISTSGFLRRLRSWVLRASVFS